MNSRGLLLLTGRSGLAALAGRPSASLLLIQQNTSRVSVIPPQHLVAFSLDTTGGAAPQFAPTILFSVGRRRRLLSALQPAAGGKRLCSICPVSPFNASMRSAISAATGCALTLPVRSVMTADVPAAATCCATCPRRSAPASACARVRSRGARRYAHVRVSEAIFHRPSRQRFRFSREPTNRKRIGAASALVPFVLVNLQTLSCRSGPCGSVLLR